MSKEVMKIYNKAMNSYQKGNYNKALKECETGISKDLKNTSLLNLKGLLYYLNGDLKGAIALWSINKDYNDDEVAKIYIKDSKGDNDKLKLFKEAQLDMKNLDIDLAINKLEICLQSDFNSINVNNTMANCLIRKGEYELAKQFNNKALRIDRKNIEALSIKNDLLQITTNPKVEYYKRIAIVSSIIFTIAIITPSVINNIKEKSKNEIINEDIKNNDYIVDKEEVEEETTEEVAKEISLNVDESKEIYVKGTNYFENKQYDKAIEVLSSAINNTNDNYLNEHILFLMASSYDNNKMIDNGIKYYEDYVNKYSKGSYIDEVYYKLAILYKEQKNIDKSKQYANLLKDNYPNSIYVNTIIKEIISS